MIDFNYINDNNYVENDIVIWNRISYFGR